MLFYHFCVRLVTSYPKGSRSPPVKSGLQPVILMYTHTNNLPSPANRWKLAQSVISSPKNLIHLLFDNVHFSKISTYYCRLLPNFSSENLPWHYMVCDPNKLSALQSTFSSIDRYISYFVYRCLKTEDRHWEKSCASKEQVERENCRRNPPPFWDVT